MYGLKSVPFKLTHYEARTLQTDPTTRSGGLLAFAVEWRVEGSSVDYAANPTASQACADTTQIAARADAGRGSNGSAVRGALLA
jgi:hypothetical protein